MIRIDIFGNINSKGYIKDETIDIEKFDIHKEKLHEIVSLVKKITNKENFYKIILKHVKSDPNEPTERTYPAKNKNCIKIYLFVIPPKDGKYYSLSEEPYIEILFNKDIGKVIYMCDYTDIYTKPLIKENSNQVDRNDHKALIQLLLKYYGYNEEAFKNFQIETLKMEGKTKIIMKLLKGNEENIAENLPNTFHIIFNQRLNKIQYFDIFTSKWGNTVLWSYSPVDEYYKNNPLMLKIKSLIDRTF